MYVFPKPIDMQLTGENKYSIHKNVWKDGQPTKWEIYFEDISYASGIKFCQNNEFANAALVGTGATWIAAWQLGAPFVVDIGSGDFATTPMVEGEAYWVYVGSDTTWTVDPL